MRGRALLSITSPLVGYQQGILLTVSTASLLIALQKRTQDKLGTKLALHPIWHPVDQKWYYWMFHATSSLPIPVTLRCCAGDPTAAQLVCWWGVPTGWSPPPLQAVHSRCDSRPSEAQAAKCKQLFICRYCIAHSSCWLRSITKRRSSKRLCLNRHALVQPPAPTAGHDPRHRDAQLDLPAV